MTNDIFDVRVELIESATRLYRVGRNGNRNGLWYDSEGRETGLIHTLSDGVAAGLPMGPHPVFRAEGRKWISTAESQTLLSLWFSRRDIFELLPRGFQVEAIDVHRYRRLHFPSYSHSVYCEEDTIALHILDPMALFKDEAAGTQGTMATT